MLLILMAGITALFLLFFVFVFFVAYKLVTPKRLIGKWTPESLGYEYKDVQIRTKDGLYLSGWYVPRGDECVILLHGYSVSRWDTVYMKKVLDILVSHNFSVFMFDFRAHGKSDGKHTTLGDKEYLDVEAAVKWVQRKHHKIAIVGYSMGGFLAVKALAYGLSKLVVADSPYVDIHATGARGMKYFASLPEWFYVFVRYPAALIAGISFRNLTLENFPERITGKCLIIGGKRDPLVTVNEIEHLSKFLKRRGAEVKVWITDAAHVRSLAHDEDAYAMMLIEFLQNSF